VPLGSAACRIPALEVGYDGSQGSVITIDVGHHGSRWTTYNAFWSLFFGASGVTPQPVAAGPLGGSAGCGTDSEGTVCTWFDNDTFGDFVGNGSSMSPSQTASLMVQFRNAIEHVG
jgi:hypothetical protein